MHQAGQKFSSFQGWQTVVRQQFPWVELANHSRRFYAAVNTRVFDGDQVSLIETGRCSATRTQRLADQCDAGCIKLFWQLSGTTQLTQDGRSLLLKPGMTSVCDVARAYEFQVLGRARFAVILLPYSACPGWDRISQRICVTRVLDGLTAKAALGALQGIMEVPNCTQGDASRDVFRALQHMLAAAFHRSALGDSQDVAPNENARFEAVQSYILNHISEPELSPAEIAQALNMSRRTLYSTLETHGLTPSRLIKRKRLERCRLALQDPQRRKESITAIAFENGFSDSSVFSRHFKTTYGESPTQWRNKAFEKSNQTIA